MSLEGRLEDLGLGDIFQIISLSKRSGVLTIIRKEGTGRLVFNKGKLIYGSSDSVSRLGYTLVKKDIITNDELEKALRIQKTNGMKLPLGAVLMKMGAIQQETLESELRNHLAEVIRDFLSWESGSFHFELGNVPGNDISLEGGLGMDFLMMEATRLQDERQREQPEATNPHTSVPTISDERMEPAEPESPLTEAYGDSEGSRPVSETASRRDLALLTAMIEELSGPSSSSEITLLVLRFASEVMNRAVVFLVRREDIIGLGQFGLSFKDESADEKIRDVRIPFSEPSLFKEVIEKKTSFKGSLSHEKWHEYFINQIGGGWPKESFLLPLINSTKVIALLYGDNLPHQTSIQETEGLEAFVKVAGFAFGKAMLERRLQEVKDQEPDQKK